MIQKSKILSIFICLVVSPSAFSSVICWKSERASILQRLKDNDTTLRTLDLGYNNIGAAGAAAIANALQANRSLTMLDLGGNDIGDAGAAAIASALQGNTALTALSFWKNDIGDACAEAIGKALQTNRTLTRLHLVYNNISDACAEAIASALQANRSLTRLDLGFTHISETGATHNKITQFLKRNQQVKHLPTIRTFLLANELLGREKGVEACLPKELAELVINALCQNS